MMARMDAYATRHPWLSDAVIVAAVLVSTILGVNLSDPDGGRPGDVVVAEVLVAVAAVTLFGARRHPRTAVVVTTGCVVAVGLLGFLLTPLVLAPVMVALYCLARAVPDRTAWAYGGIVTVVVVAIAVGDHLDRTVALRAVGPALWLLLPLVLGNRVRLQAAYLTSVRARAEYAERTREEEARLRVAEDRLRIARDLHDVVAHHMAVANAQAGTAGHLLDSDPDNTRRLLTALQTTTSNAMLELRSAIGTLRGLDDDEVDALAPAPGLAQVPDLVDAYRSAGLEVTSEVRGHPQQLLPGVELTAYRIVQEALTNATKHGGTNQVHLLLAHTSAGLTIKVSNPVVGAANGSRNGTPGYGLIGMQERAHAVGGELQIATTDAGSFEIITTLPTREPQ